MSVRQNTSRCWLCDNAIWLLPIWTWLVACVTGLLIIGLVRPPDMTAWLSLMGLLVLPIAACVAVFVAEEGHDRARVGKIDDEMSPTQDNVRSGRVLR
jgi:hypothetical protein